MSKYAAVFVFLAATVGALGCHNGAAQNKAVAPSGRVLVASEANDQVYVLRLTNSDPATVKQTVEAAYGDVVADLGHVNSPSGIAVADARHEVFVANTNGASVLVYAYPPSPTLTPLRVIKGGATGLTHPIGVAYLPKTNEIAILQDKAPHLLVFRADAGDNASPVRRGVVAADRGEPLSLAADADTGSLFVGFYEHALRVSPDLTEQTAVKLGREVLAMGLAYESASATLWVSDFMHNRVAAYTVAADGSADRGQEVSGAAIDWPFGVAVCGSTVAVASFGGRSIALFDTAKPVQTPRVIAGANTKLVYPRAVACSASTGELIAADYGADALAVWNLKSSGDVAPSVYAAHSYEGLSRPRGLFVDADRQELYVASYGSDGIFVYDTATGTAGAAKRVLRGAATKLSGPEGVIVHPKTKEIYVANIISNTVTVYPAGAVGDIAPVRIVAGDKTGLNWPYGIALDVARETIYVSSLKGNTIAAWPTGATGNQAPKWSLGGKGAALSGPEFLSYDGQASELYVTNALSGSVNVYDLKLGEPRPSPVRSISGDKTGLNSPEGVWVDHLSGRVFVADFRTNTVLAFDRLADGNAAPVAIGHSDTTLAAATGIAYIP